MPIGRIPGPLGVTDWSGRLVNSVSPLGESSPHQYRSYAQFLTVVLKAAIEDRLHKGRQYYPAIPASELARVEGDQFLRTIAAASCLRLLRAARQHRQDQEKLAPTDPQKEEKQRSAQLTTHRGVGSSYRNYERELGIWKDQCFPKYYRATALERASVQGGSHGDAAVGILVRYFSPRKAPPGFSNHSDGRAVDFITTQSGVTYGANSSQRQAWRQTWFHQWLVSHAREYQFFPLASEEWHWNFR